MSTGACGASWAMSTANPGAVPVGDLGSCGDRQISPVTLLAA